MGPRRNGRGAIIDAALTCTRADGWEATSMHRVRERAGISNGTLFHHFPTRDALAAAVIAAGLADHQTAMQRTLQTAETAADGVRRAVLRHLRWIEENPQVARLVLASTPEALRAGLDPDAIDANRTFFAGVAAWLRGHGWSGTPPLPLLVALWIGPSQEYARAWLTAAHEPLLAAGPPLAEGAWRAVAPHLHIPSTPKETS